MPAVAPGARPPQKAGKGAWGGDAAAQRGPPNVGNLDASEDPPLPSRSVPKPANAAPRQPAWGPKGAWAKPAPAVAPAGPPLVAADTKQEDAAVHANSEAAVPPPTALASNGVSGHAVDASVAEPVNRAAPAEAAAVDDHTATSDAAANDQGSRQAGAQDSGDAGEIQQQDAQVKPPPATRPLSRDDLECMEVLGVEERQMFRALQKQVADEARSGGSRTRYSILKNFVSMTSAQMELCIDLYQQHMARQMPAAAKAAAAKAKGNDDVDATPPPPAPGLEPRSESPAPGLDKPGVVKLPPQPTGQAPVAPPSPVRTPLITAATEPPPEQPPSIPEQEVCNVEPAVVEEPCPSAVAAEPPAEVPALPEEKKAETAEAAGPPAPAEVSAPAIPLGKPDVEWVRKKAFQLRMNTVKPDVLASILENLDAGQMEPPFSELKMWLGLDESEPVAPALQQLIKEYRAACCGS